MFLRTRLRVSGVYTEGRTGRFEWRPSGVLFLLLPAFIYFWAAPWPAGFWVQRAQSGACFPDTGHLTRTINTSLESFSKIYDLVEDNNVEKFRRIRASTRAPFRACCEPSIRTPILRSQRLPASAKSSTAAITASACSRPRRNGKTMVSRLSGFAGLQGRHSAGRHHHGGQRQAHDNLNTTEVADL